MEKLIAENVLINNEHCNIYGFLYQSNKRLGLNAVDREGLPYARLTVNIPEVNIIEGELILDVNNLPDIVSDLLKANLIEDTKTSKYVVSGYVHYPIVKLKIKN